jgi:hypothetical protein
VPSVLSQPPRCEFVLARAWVHSVWCTVLMAGTHAMGLGFQPVECDRHCTDRAPDVMRLQASAGTGTSIADFLAAVARAVAAIVNAAAASASAAGATSEAAAAGATANATASAASAAAAGNITAAANAAAAATLG